MHRHPNTGKAFTLIELLVVISIIALLVGVLLPVLSNAKKQALVVACGSNAHQIAVMYHAYSVDSKDEWPTPPDPTHWPFGEHRNDQAVPTGKNAAAALLFDMNYTGDSRVFYCPVAESRSDSSFRHDEHWDLNGDGSPEDSFTSYVYYAGYTPMPGVELDVESTSRSPLSLPNTVIAADMMHMFGGGHPWNNHDDGNLRQNTASPNSAQYPWANYVENVGYEGGNVILTDGSASWRSAEETSLRYLNVPTGVLLGF